VRRTSLLAAVLVASAPTLLAPSLLAQAGPTLIGSTDDGTLVIFEADRPQAIRTVRSTGLGGRLVGVDSRPADGHLFGLTTSNDVYRIDPTTGTSTLVSTLTIPFDGDVRSGLAFNPQTDRLRVLSADGQNLRINVTLGATAADSPLAYAPGDRNAGKRPRIAAHPPPASSRSTPSRTSSSSRTRRTTASSRPWARWVSTSRHCPDSPS